MSEDRNKKLVNDTFDKKYNRKQFVWFIKNLLNGIQIEENVPTNSHIHSQFKDYIKSYSKLGEYISTDTDKLKKYIDVIEINSIRTSSVEKARSMQRNFVAKHLRDTNKDACLVAFINEDKPQDWRFSLVKMDYKTEIKTGKDGNKERVIIEELTPAKRFSFLVGENENTHTAQQQLFKCLEKSEKGEKLTLEDLTNAFNIEKVSQEFFDKYQELFKKFCKELQRIYKSDSKVKEDFDKHNINVIDNEKNDFAKKTLGQLVFLYFIQKKGWLGVKENKAWGTGDKKFLRTLFDKKNYQNFFNDILEPLFYEALAKEQPNDNSYYKKLECRIPFLNGGLFEPINNYSWEKTDLTIKNELFEKIFDVFDLYNFTVKEDEPLEKEIAIDPEMLGKVFENLLPENIRKGNGAFYTPREIVHYMCQESLINYLDTQLNKDNKVIKREDLSILVKRADSIYSDNKSEILPESIKLKANEIDTALANIKICDPAIGSGAFPVGIMTELVRTRMALNDYLDDENKNRTSYQLKRNAIENSIYGVDLDSGAVEIAKLRFYLSLVVDEENIKNIKPLPNLDFKIMQGNSLISSYEGIDFDKILEPSKNKSKRKLTQDVLFGEKPQTQGELFSNETDTVITKIKQKLNQFVNVPYAIKKNEFKHEIEDLMIDLIKSKLKETEIYKGSYEKNIKIIEQKVANLIANRENRNFFPWKLFFADVFEKGGFDVVIGNPPYIKEYTNKNVFTDLKNSSYYKGKMDLWYFFGCIGIDLLKENGIETYIAPNNWITNSGASIFRNKVLKETQILDFIDFGNYKIFDTADIQTMIYILKKSKKISNYFLNYQKLNKDTIDKNELNLFLSNIQNIELYTKYNLNFNNNVFFNKFITFLNPQTDKLIKKIRNGNKIFLQDKEIAQGIVAPQDFLNSKAQKKLGDKFVVGESIFAMTNSKKQELNLTKDERNIVKPLYTTKEISKYFANKNNNLWIIYTSSAFKNRNKMLKYPNLKKHLDKFQKIITSTYKPYGLHRSREEKFFVGEKIISLRKCLVPSFAYVDFDSYVLQTFYVIKSNNIDLKYLTGILNSKLIAYWLKKQGKMQGNNYQIDKEPLMNIPVYKPTEQQEHNIVNIVDKILSLTTQKNYLSNKQSQEQVKKYQQEIDKKIYKFYDLTQEEIDIIEKQS